MLESQRAELQRLGYSIVAESEYEVVGVRGKWYWDCFATHITSVVFLRATGPLTAAHIAGETEAMVARARELDPFPLPVGFQHGRAVVPVYVADRVEPDAQQLCVSAQKMRFSTQYFPAALDRSSGQPYFLRSTPLWGGVYFAKWRHLVQRLIYPQDSREREPISVFGTVYGLFLLVILLGLFLGMPLFLFLLIASS